ncbi:succinoglycan biosynthesis protein ExoV [Rhizobium binae]|uniref:Succinoglycan biosynthesis protein ExoV n=1 Tax=Rhizobium binae TaxID=1138190 RepID=A0ABV2M8A7_9HYPH|nr:exopolysaccharide glucosyl ketal-pyruvate-transferase [Rhizobium binae]MBX4991666.1 polysaccharide pyruvyl transferase family protein [Rhizobium binae]NKL50565.1 polysaccharide pyruvyl transferase family protein [Rhizobium leguminosarum bv. viciae]QSY81326.1 polysaccharide pyruvyl transferase family protein [Rhizobium binae]
MKIFAYRGKHENFGDELNHWLWERLLPGFFDEDENQLFLGIGSILYDHFDPQIQKIVFGSGYGGYTNPPKVDGNWTFYFVRGKKTAEVLGIDPSYAIGDSGILTRSCWDAKSVEKRYPVSFMPHYESAMYGSWDKVCELAGIHYIDPRWSVEKVLTEISASHKVVSEAMHGCIISDALRVPWRAIRPIAPGNRAKWYDWASALDLEIDFDPIGPSNLVEVGASLVRKNTYLLKNITFRHRRIRQLTGNYVFGSTVKTLQRVAEKPGQLSSDASIEGAHDKMLVELNRLKQNFSKKTASAL